MTPEELRLIEVGLCHLQNFNQNIINKYSQNLEHTESIVQVCKKENEEIVKLNEKLYKIIYAKTYNS